MAGKTKQQQMENNSNIIKKWFKKKDPSEDFIFVRDIVRKYLEDDSIQKIVSPLSQEYFLVDNKRSISVCVSSGRVEISNHKFLYIQSFPLKNTESLIDEILVGIDKERQILKKQLFENQIDLLKKIYEL